MRLVETPRGMHVLFGDDKLPVDVKELALSVQNSLADLQQGMTAPADETNRLSAISSHDAEPVVKFHRRPASVTKYESQ